MPSILAPPQKERLLIYFQELILFLHRYYLALHTHPLFASSLIYYSTFVYQIQIYYVYVFLTTKVLLDISLLYMNNKQQLPSIIAINYINSYNISYIYTLCNTILLKIDSYISYSMNVIVYHNIPVSIHCLIGLQC